MSASTSPLPYTGNKSCIVNTILTVMPKHNVYIEPCKVIVNMPFRSYKANGETKYVDTFHPITAEARNELYDAVKEAYEQALEERMADLEHEGASMSQQM